MALLTEILQNPIYQRKTNQDFANGLNFDGIPQTEWQGQTMKDRLARPTASAATRMSNSMESVDPALGYMKGGEWLSAITNGLKTGLGFYGAIKDAKAQDAYNQQLAELAAQERADKQAQQAFENDYKNRELAQKETLQQGQFANQKEMQASQLANARDIEAMKILAAQEQAKQANANAIAAERRKAAQEQALHDRALSEQGIDPELYKSDANYRAQINQAIKQQVLQDQINAANIELGKSGKVGMDKVQQVIADPSRKLEYGDNGLLANAIGWNKFGISSPDPKYVAPMTLSQVTENYKNPQPIVQETNEQLPKGTQKIGRFRVAGVK